MRMKSWTMNCGLLLLLVAALYTTGCVHAKTITVDDAKRAVTAAWKLYSGANTLQKSYTATVKLDNGQDVVVKCYFGAHGEERLDCGLPPHQYLLPESKADQVGNWFITKIAADGKGKYRKAMEKKDCGRCANLWHFAIGKEFNYHLEVDDKSSLNLKLLAKLLSQMLN